MELKEFKEKYIIVEQVEFSAMVKIDIQNLTDISNLGEIPHGENYGTPESIETNEVARYNVIHKKTGKIIDGYLDKYELKTFIENLTVRSKDEKIKDEYQELLDYPLETIFYYNGEELGRESDSLQSALYGVDYSLVTYKEFKENTGITENEKSENMFYVFDTSEEKNEVESYEYQGATIKEVVNNIINWGILDLEYYDDENLMLVNNEKMDVDFIERRIKVS